MGPILCAVVITVVGCSSATRQNAAVEGTPLGAMFGYDPVYGESSPKVFDDKVRSCMVAAGFKYFGRANAGGESRELAMDKARTSGYGIAAGSPFSNPESDKASQQASKDELYRESLSDSERIQYDLALIGPQRVAGEDLPMSQLGCVPNTQVELYGFEGQAPNSVQLMIDDIRAAVRADPVVIAVNRQWSACLASQGFPGLVSRDETLTALSKELDRELGGQQQPGDSSGVVQYSATDQQAQQILSAFRANEIATAVADVDCATKLKVAAVTHDATTRAEQQFIDEHPGYTLGSLTPRSTSTIAPR